MIRLAEAADAPGITAIYAPVVARTAISFEVVPPTEAEMGVRVAAVLEHAPWLVCADDREGRILGYAYASKHRERAAYQWSVDVSVYVREDQRRRGVGRALYTSLFALLRLQGFYTAYAGITLPNAASVGVHESLGFSPVGVYRSVGFKNGAWHDVGWWERPLRDRSGAPEPPLLFSHAAKRDGFAEALAAGEPILVGGAGRGDGSPSTRRTPPGEAR
jgi:phosphinothricin acetyltransferase